MMTNNELLKRREQAVPRGVATAYPIFAEHAKNSELWDVEGNRYIDFVGGISVLNTGHSHPAINQAVSQQIEKFSHTAFQVVAYEAYIELAEKLNKLAPGPTPKKTIFLSTGAEALENAVKISRAHTQRPNVISFIGGFHGRTIFTSGMTGKNEPYKTGFGPFPGEIFHVPFPAATYGVSESDSLKALSQLFKASISPESVAAIVIEPVQGEGGFHAASREFFQSLRTLCDDHGICLVCDEVQTCFGRTGTLFASEQIGIEPDLITAAKSLAGGYPLSAVIGKAAIMDAPNPGGLGGTYSGSPVACAAALAVIEVIEQSQLLARSQAIGEELARALIELKSTHPALGIGDIRHKGAMFAFDLLDSQGNPDAQKTKSLLWHAQQNGLLLLSCGLYGNTIRIMVPLTVSDAILQEGIILLANSLRAVTGTA